MRHFERVGMLIVAILNFPISNFFALFFCNVHCFNNLFLSRFFDTVTG